MASAITRPLALVVLAFGVGAIAWTTLRSDPVGPSVAEIRAADAAQEGADPAADEPVGSREEETDPIADPAADAEAEGDAGPDEEAIPVLGVADTLTDLDGWLNTDATSLEEIRAGHELTVVWFWTFGCRNCKNTIPSLQAIEAEFGDRIEIVGVHSPEFAHEAVVDNIVQAAADLGVTWPIALDTEKRNFHRWQDGPTGFWPRAYLIDGNNQIRMDERGDGTAGYAQLADNIERLLAGEV